MSASEFIPDEMKDEDFTEDDSNEVPPNDIVAFNELRSCADLFRLYKEKVLDIEPDFQREFVWQPAAQTRFIDSLTKQLPIPSMCLAFDYKKERWIAIDGRQRLGTIIRFMQKGDWRLSNLSDINPEIAGKSAARIGTEGGDLYKYYQRVSNTSIPINVLRCDFSNGSHMEYIFTIFHRLNSGGIKLNNQEIRNCIFQGSFNSFLEECDQFPEWRKLNRMKDGLDYRRVKQEIILRFFAFREELPTYKGQIAKFLNQYMKAHQDDSEVQLDAREKIFTQTVKIALTALPRKVPAIPTSVMEAMLVGISNNLTRLETESPGQIVARYTELRADKNFSGESVSEGLSKKDKTADRFSAATRIFG